MIFEDVGSYLACSIVSCVGNMGCYGIEVKDYFPTSLFTFYLPLVLTIVKEQYVALYKR